LLLLLRSKQEEFHQDEKKMKQSKNMKNAVQMLKANAFG
jgi:hypothetical protein